jgi:hypothetical protein
MLIWMMLPPLLTSDDLYFNNLGQLTFCSPTSTIWTVSLATNNKNKTEIDWFVNWLVFNIKWVELLSLPQNPNSCDLSHRYLVNDTNIRLYFGYNAHTLKIYKIFLTYRKRGILQTRDTAASTERFIWTWRKTCLFIIWWSHSRTTRERTWCRNFSPFRRTWVHPRFLVRFVLLDTW